MGKGNASRREISMGRGRVVPFLWDALNTHGPSGLGTAFKV